MNINIIKKLNRTKANFIRHIRVICSLKHMAKNITLLEPGIYKVQWFNKPILFNADTGTEIQDVFQANTGFCDRLFKNIKIKILNNGQNEGRKCQALMLIYKKGRYKLFDLKNELIFSFFPSDELEKYVKSINVLKQFYDFAFVESKGNFVVEKYIKNIPIRTMDHNISFNFYAKVLSDTNELYKYLGSTSGITLQDEISSINKIKIPKELWNFTYMIAKESDMLNSVPTVLQHCDLHFDNLLFDGTKLYYIDFEYARNENFLFDIFNLPYVEFIDGSTNFYIDLLLNQDKDTIYRISEIFISIGVQFDVKMIKVYMCRFLLSRIKFDVLNADSEGKIFHEYCLFLLERYRNFWEYINNFGSKWNET